MSMWYLTILLLTTGLLFPCGVPAAEPELTGLTTERRLQSMTGEQYHYPLDFMAFRGLAEAQLQLTAEATPGRYRAELVARTLGVASWLTGERTQHYVAVMEVDDAGHLRSVSYESLIRKRKGKGAWGVRQKRYRFDYPAGKVYQEIGENDQFTPGLVFELPAGPPPVDILTGFYNLRSGVYGALKPGAKLKIPTFTAKGISAIKVEVLTGQARMARPFFPESGILLRVTIDPEVFHTSATGMYVWFDEAGRPARGIVEGVIGLGDVYGHLKEGQPPP